MARKQVFHTSVKEVLLPQGFSWRLFLFGPLYPLYLGDFPASLLLFLLYLPMAAIVFGTKGTGIFGFLLLNIPFACAYNWRIRTLFLSSGYKPGALSTPKTIVNEISPWQPIEKALGATTSNLWYTIKLYGSTTSANTRGITMGKGLVPAGYHTLCGFLKEQGSSSCRDELDKGATITIKANNKSVWQFTASEKTHLAEHTFLIPVKEGDNVAVTVKQGNSKLDHLRIVLVH